MLTLGQATTALSRYIGVNNNATDRINQVIERLTKSGNWRGTKQLVSFVVYSDDDGLPIITLPNKFNTVLAGNFFNGTTQCSFPLPVRNQWYSYLPGGYGVGSCLCLDSFVEVPGRYVTFLGWNQTMFLRFKFEQSETSGKIIIRGTFNGDQIFSLDGSNWIEGIAVSYTGSADVTTTQQFDRSPYTIIKPVTKGRVSMYTVDSGGAESLVAVYQPNETLPAWRRYRVPSCTAPITVSFPFSQFYTKAEVDSMFGASDTITVNSTVTDTLSPNVPFFEWNQRIIAQAGFNPYVSKFILDGSNAKKNAIFRIVVEIDPTSHPTIRIFNPTDNSVLQEIDGDLSNATSFFFQARWTGTDWVKIEGYFLV